MRHLYGHPKQLTLVAFGIAAAAVLAIALSSSLSAFLHAWSHLHPLMLVWVAVGAILAVLAYVVAYRGLMHFDEGPRISIADAIRVVAHGFGPFVPAGGFDVDKRAIGGLDGDTQEAGMRVFAIAALELAVLTPAAAVSAAVLLVKGHPHIGGSVLWPWVIGVPVAFVAVLLLVGLRHDRVDPRVSGVRGVWGRAVSGVWMLTDLGRRPSDGWPALGGMAAYWAADILSFIAAARCLGVHINVWAAIVAYATGYALTRRSLPLGGAGITEALMTFSLHWVAVPLPRALAVVIVYRLFNFVLLTPPALWVHGRVMSFFAGSGSGSGSGSGAGASASASAGASASAREPDALRG